jgi:prepilin-type processing-associated H-X9-DG protein
LVLIAIVGVISALLLAAIQKARAAANRVICANNLRQLALAAHHYDAHFGALPPNYHEDPSRSDGSHNLFYGPIVPLLPFLELESAYRNFSFLYYDGRFPDPIGVGWPNVAGGMDWAHHTYQRNPFNRPPLASTGSVAAPNPLSCPNPTGATNIAGQTWGAQGDFKVLSCPSQPFSHEETNQGSVVMHFLHGLPRIDMPVGNPYSDPVAGVPQCLETNSEAGGFGCTVQGLSYAPGRYVVGRSDYVAVVGAFVDTRFTNPAFTPAFAQKYHSLFNYRVNASLARVPDGTSNTLLLGEYCGALSNQNPQPQLNGWNAASWATPGLSVVFGTCPDPNNSLSLGGYCDYSSSGGRLGSGYALGGWHNGMFQVAFADGSVRSLQIGLDRQLLLSLAGYADGDVVGGFE